MGDVRLVLVLIAACLAATGRASAQPPASMEVGAQAGMLRMSGIGATDFGVGGRFAWNATDAFALEAAGDFFLTGRHDVPRGGWKLHALFGPRMGWRRARAGIFAKTRAGVARLSEGRQQGACVLIFPPPERCYSAETRLAFDLGGVAEVYPSARSILRIDISDIATHLGKSSARFARRGDFTHDLNVSAGLAWRF